MCIRDRDSSVQFSDKFPDTGAYPAADDLATVYQGGGFAAVGPRYQD